VASRFRSSRGRTDIWPGFVDALAALLMAIIFLLMLFVIAQFFLGEAISGRDQALDRLRGQVSELADLLALERQANAEHKLNIGQLSEELQATVSTKDELAMRIRALNLRAEQAEEQASRMSARATRFEELAARSKEDAAKSKEDAARSRALSAELGKKLEDAFKTIKADRATIELKVRELAALTQDIEALSALRAELEEKIRKMAGSLEKKEGQLAVERELSDTAQAQVALLNQNVKALREQIARLAAALDASEEKAKNQKVRIANLGQKLNAALAGKVTELTRYRSEFFGRLRTLLGRQRGIQIVGDRFVFQSEVLFQTGSADLGEAGQAQLGGLAETLIDIAQKIPPDLKWILRVDGHTDKIPISTNRFPSNWELSTARAISVVKFLIQQGIPPTNMAATGFGEYQPLDQRDDEIAHRRNRRIELKLTQR
jgi:chemotaxis protein MotB